MYNYKLIIHQKKFPSPTFLQNKWRIQGLVWNTRFFCKAKIEKQMDAWGSEEWGLHIYIQKIFETWLSFPSFDNFKPQNL